MSLMRLRNSRSRWFTAWRRISACGVFLSFPRPQKQNKDLLRSVQPLMDDVAEGRQGAWKRITMPGRPSPHRSANPVIRPVLSLGFPTILSNVRTGGADI
jgi:hypothetical protein